MISSHPTSSHVCIYASNIQRIEIDSFILGRTGALKINGVIRKYCFRVNYWVLLSLAYLCSYTTNFIMVLINYVLMVVDVATKAVAE